MKRLIFLILGIFGAVGIILVLTQQSSIPVTDDNQVSVSIFPLYDITREIAGDDVNVELLLPPGASPHTFSPTPSSIATLEQSDMLFVAGLELDPWAEEMAEGLDVPVKTLSVGVDLLRYEDEDDHDEEDGHDVEDDHAHGEYDPHYWLDPYNAMQIIDTVTFQLSSLYPEHQVDFEERAYAYKTELRNLDASIQLTLGNLAHRHIITMHDAWDYFARAYDLEILGTIETSPGKELSSAHLLELIELIETEDIQVIFTEPQLDISSLTEIAADYELEIRTLDPLGGVDQRTSYIRLMEYNANIIAQ